MYRCRLPEALGHAPWNDHCLIIDSTCILRLRSTSEAGGSPLFPGLTGNGPSLRSSLILCFAVIDFESSSNRITEEGKRRLKRLVQLTKGFLLLPRGWCSRSESRLHCLLSILATSYTSFSSFPFLDLYRIGKFSIQHKLGVLRRHLLRSFHGLACDNFMFACRDNLNQAHPSHCNR